jgi:hypothetical protein
MVAELEEIKDAIWEQCREDGMTLYTVGSTLDMAGVKVAMEEDELEKLLGKDPVHMMGDGFLALAIGTLKMIENRRTLFVGEKRERRRAWTWRTTSRLAGWPGRTTSGSLRQCLGREDGRWGRRQRPRSRTRGSPRTTPGRWAGTATPSKKRKGIPAEK